MRLLVGSVLVAVACAATASARAQTRDPVSVALDWHRAPGAERCVDQATIQREVETRLGRRIFTTRAHADVVVDARLAALASGGGFHADLTLSTSHGESLGVRELGTQSTDCSELDASLALVIALMIDIPRSDLPPAPVTTPRTPPRTTPIRVPPRRVEPWRFAGRAGAVVALGLLPGVALGGQAGVAVEPPLFWRTELDGTLWRGAEATDGRSGSRFDLLAVGLRVCPVATHGSARVDICAGQQIGRVRATGFGFDDNRREDRLFYMVSLLGRAGMPIAGPLALEVGMGLDLPVTRDHFAYTRADSSRRELFRMAPVVAEGQLGLAIQLP